MARNPKLQQAFDQALQLLGAGKLKDATDAMQSIRQQGFTSPALEADLGRALVETGDPGHGVLHLMNAVALDRMDSSYRHDLLVAQSRVEGGVGLPMSHPSEWGFKIGSYIRPTESLALAAVFLLVLLGTRFLRPLSKRIQIGLAACILVFIALGIFAQSARSIAIVTREADLKSAPLASSDVLQSLKPGTRLRIIRNSGNFSEVERPNAFRGWMSSNELAPANL
jgi:hypothetical protein